MKFFVRILSCKSISINIEESSVVKQLKEKIEEVEGIESKIQTLVYEGKVLDDVKFLSNYKIENDSTLQLRLSLKGGLLVYIKLYSNGKIIPLDVDTQDSIENVKARIEEKEGIPSENQILIMCGVQLENGRILCDYKTLQKETTIHLIVKERKEN